MKLADWWKDHVALALATHLDGRRRTQLPAAWTPRRGLRSPEPLEPRWLLTTFVVNDVGDSPDFDLGDGVADSDSGAPGVQVSLRSAIQNANLDAVADNIHFNIPGAGVKLISPTTALPAITQPVVIDGYTQPTAMANTLAVGSNATILIQVDGLSAGAATSGLTVAAGGSTVRGLSITRFAIEGVFILGPGSFSTIAGNFLGVPPSGNVDMGNGRNGVEIDNSAGNFIGGSSPVDRNVISGNNNSGVGLVGTNSINNVIEGNYIGTNAAGDGDIGNSEDGITITQRNTGGGIASQTFIGGTTPGAGNVISGNDQSGVTFVGAGAGLNVVEGIRIGVNAAGTAALGNTLHGVLNTLAGGIFGNMSSPSNSIGGTTPAARNVISGNGRAGVAMFGVGATGNKVQGNYIGADVTGTLAIPNANDGVRFGGNDAIGSGPSGNFIGGTEPGAGNLISGNMDNGVELAGATTSGNRIEGNLIGTIVGGSGARPNQNHGVLVENAPNTVIGGTTAGARNVISGNGGSGVRLNAAGATGTVIAGNYIGVTADAVAGLPNQASGVRIGANASSNMVGGTTADAANVIAYNADRGVVIESGSFNTVRLNSIYDNIGIGVDLNNNHDSLNDPDDADVGANGLQNWPEITGLAVVGGMQKASGFMDGASDTTYTLDFYFNGGILPTSLGEGRTYVTSSLLTTDADGFVNFTVDLPLLVPSETFVTVAATDPDGNTSEFAHDADVDALYDHWETGSQIDGDFDGVGDDFILAGADPLRKDLYVEVDAMVGRVPTLATLTRVVDAFAAAPNIYNPNGSGGIALHIDLDDTNVALQDFPADFADFHIIKDALFGTASEFGATRAAKRLAYRYCIFGNTRAGGSSSGRGEIGGNDFMVTLGAWNTPGGTPDQQAGTFMHELGHTLGLRHGGADDLQYKPNYYSIMNYTWQTPKPLYREFWRLDYSSSALPALDEHNLSEMAGIGGPVGVRTMIKLPLAAELVEMNGPVDWSRDDQDLDMIFDNDLLVIQDVNDDASLDLFNGFEDWSHIVYGFRQNSQFDDGANPGPADVELSYDMYLQTNEELLESMTADFDSDRDVDGADFLRWQRGLGAPDAEISNGDADYDDVVDGVDLYVWQSLFGTSDAQSAAVAAKVIDPSPSATLDIRALAALWPDLHLDRAISAKPASPPEPVVADARAVVFSLLASGRPSGDDDADLPSDGDKRFDHDVNEAPVHETRSDSLEVLWGGMERGREPAFTRQSS